MVDFSDPKVLAVYIISTLGFTMFVIASALKKKNHILFTQSAGNFLCALSEAISGAWSGFFQDLVNLIRNVLVIKGWMNKLISILIIVIGTGLGIFVFIYVDYKNYGWWALLPVIATFQYSIVVLIPNVKIPLLKTSIGVGAVCWAIYGIATKIYTMTFFNSITIILSIVSIIQYYRLMNKAKKEDMTLSKDNA